MPSFRMWAIAIPLLALALLAAGDEVEKPAELPHSPKARAAIDKHRAAADKARAEYYAKLLALDTQLVKDLDAALKAVARTGDTNEIELISAAHKHAQAELKRHRDESSNSMYWLWEVTWNTNMHSKIWLMSDGTCIEQSGVKGFWQRRGNQMVIQLNNGNRENDIVSEDGTSYVGTNKGHERLAGKLVGTSLDGAPPPPK
jgi:hypothetical protein